MPTGRDGPTGPDALDVVEGFTDFDADERECLQVFQQHMRDIDELELAQRQSMTLNFADGTSVKDADREQVSALISAYRKVALLDRDPGNFNRVRKILGRHAHEKATPTADRYQAWLQDLKKMRAGILGEARISTYRVREEDGTEKELEPREVLDWLVNGVISHSDKEARQRWDGFGGWDSGVLQVTALVAVMDDLQVFRGLAEVVGEILAASELHA